MSPGFPTFLVGLVLGGGGAWILSHPAPITPPGSAGMALPGPLPAWSWRDSETPASLSGAALSVALSSWFDLRAPEGGPASFAARATALRALIARLPPDEFPRLIGRLATRATPAERPFLRLAFDLWVELDPSAAAAWAGTVADSPGLDAVGLASQAGRRWATLDPLAAAAWACAVPDETRARQLAELLLPLLAARDSARALALASTRDGTFLDALLPSILGELANDDPAATLRAHGDRLARYPDGFFLCLSAWTQRDPTAALAWIAARPERDTVNFANWFSHLDAGPGDAAILATALATVPGLPGRQAALGRFLSSWAMDRPDAAIAWLNALPDPNLRTVLLERASAFSRGAAPELSLPLALALPEGAHRTSRLARLLGWWAERDPAAALAWTETRDDPGVVAATPSIQAAILGAIARDEPATALAEWEKLPAGAARQTAIIPIARAWGESDPGAAFRWLNQRRDVEDIAGLREDLLQGWAQKEPVAAIRWVLQADPSFEKDALYVRSGIRNDVASHAAIADLFTRIANPAIRTETLISHLEEWLTKDRPAAQAWLESHDALTPAQAAALLAPAK